MPRFSEPNADEVLTIAYNTAPDALRREIAVLQQRAYGSAGAVPSAELPALHDPALEARSFLLRVDGRLVGYAGVVTRTIRHGDQSFTIAGLSSVATHPDVQRRGFGSRTVAAATRYIERSGVDIGIFTCAPHLASFYGRAGSWPVAPDVVLIGSRDAGALTSAALGVVVLMRLFSARAQAASETLCNATIDLDLPLGQFL